MPKCAGINKAGKPCSSWALDGKDHCFAHDKESKESGRFGGAQPGAGRPKLPKPHEELRRRVENDLKKWLKPYEDALHADKAVVTTDPMGVQYVKLVADHPTRMKAAHDVLDRVYGKAAQSIEHTGAEGGPIRSEIAVDDRQAAEAVQEFLRRVRP